jgi:hypothetical protein
MLIKNKIIEALNIKAEEFAKFENQLNTDALFYDQKLLELISNDYDNLLNKLDEFPAPGAIPSKEFLESNNLVIKFEQDWTNHESARRWAYETLLNHPTFAVDGSQIMPIKELSLPVAAIQVAWFENPHTPDGKYTKNTKFEVLSPNDLLMGKNVSERQVSDQMVNLRRFQLEIETICDYMENYATKSLTNKDFTKESPPIVFLDGSIVISFAERWHEDQRKLFTEPIIKLLDMSKETQIPVIGYIDTTYACDIAVMLKYFFLLDVNHSPIHDAYLFRNLSWGDRTIFFTCARAGLLDHFEEHKRGIGFTYLKTSQALPARLDIPTWVYEKGLLDYVIDIVRAETIVGLGYPYPLATADKTAFISVQDREAFYRLFQQFAKEKELKLNFSQKALSKNQNR